MASLSYSVFSKKKDSRDFCEDCYLIIPEKKFFTICDGVGGYRKRGINPRNFPEQLLQNVKLNASKEKLSDVLVESFKKTHADGGATVCMAKIDGKRLVYLNLGDCRVVVVRNNKIVFSTKPGQKEFNYPYQLGRLYGKERKFLKHIEEGSFQLKENDFLVLGSDGLFDNLFDNEITDFVLKNKDKKDLAKLIVEESYKFSIDRNRESPFSKKSDGKYFGGKKDDITVIVINFKNV